MMPKKVRFSDVRIPRAVGVAIAMAVVTCSVILYRTRHFMFLNDEWDFLLDAKHWQLMDFFQPHNEHWSTIPQLVYRLLVSSIGTWSYIPYEAALLLAHGATALLLFLLIRQRSGDAAALFAAALVLVLGRGFDDILWAFQVGFVGSVATGLLAVWLLRVTSPSLGRLIGASVATLASLMSSGIGPLFLVLIGTELALDRTRRRALLTLLPPALALIVWELTLGKRGVTQDPFHLSLNELGVLVEYVPNGIGAAVAGIFGLSSHWARIGVAGLTAIVTIGVMRTRRPNPYLIAPLLTLIAMYTLTGYERGRLGVDQATAARYIYIGGVFVLLVFAEVVRELPWRAIWITIVSVPVIVGVCYSAKVLNDRIVERNVESAQAVVQVQTLTAVCGAPNLPAGVVFAETMPSVSPARYCVGIKSMGLPVPRATLQEIQQRDPVDSDVTLRRVFAEALRLEPAKAEPAAGQCMVVGTRTVLSVAPGGQLRAQSTSPDVPLQISLSSALPPPSDPSATLTLPAGTSRIALPDTGQRAIQWQVGLSTPEGSHLIVCQQ